MAVDSTERRVVYAGNGKTTAFPFVFKVFADTDVVVSVGKPDGAEAAATLKINSDYTVTLNADQNTTPGGTVNVKTAPDEGYNLAVTSSVPYDQPMVLTPYGGFNPETLNNNSDRQAIQIQQLVEQVSRALITDPTDTITPRQLRDKLLAAVDDAIAAAGASKETLAACEAIKGFIERYSWDIPHLVNSLEEVEAYPYDGYFWVKGYGNPGNAGEDISNRLVGGLTLARYAGVRGFGAVGNGTHDDTDSVQKMITAVGYAYFPPGRYLLSTTTIDAPVYFGAGAAVISADGATVSFRGGIDSPRQYIFQGNGKYDLGNDANSGENARQVHSSWFGASPSVTVSDDQTDFIQKACDSFGNGREGVVLFDVGNYYVSSTIKVSRGIWVKGQGSRRTVFRTETDGYPIFQTIEQGCRFTGLQFEPSAITKRLSPFIQLDHSTCEVDDIRAKAASGVVVNNTQCVVSNVGGVSGVDLGEDSALVRVMADGCTLRNIYADTSNTGFGSLVCLDSSVRSVGNTLIDGVKCNMPGIPVLVKGNGNSIVNTLISNIRSAVYLSATKNSPAAVRVVNDGAAPIRAIQITGVQALSKCDYIVSIEQNGTSSTSDIHLSNICNANQKTGIRFKQTAGSLTHIIVSDTVDVKSAETPYEIIGNVTDLAIAPTALGNARPPTTYDLTIDDDGVQVIHLGRNVFTGFILISSGYSHYGFYLLRAAATMPTLTKIFATDSFNTMVGVTPTGTTGTDTKITVAVNGTDVYLENRLGNTQRVSCTIFTGIQ